MKLSKFLFIAFLFTGMSLLYVYQQSEIFRLAYLGQKREVVFQELLDKNTILQYNIKKSASLVRIGNRISQDSNFQMPDYYHLVRLNRAQEKLKSRSGALARQNLFARIFAVRQEAEAYTINP